jgi:hypothetical protein
MRAARAPMLVNDQQQHELRCAHPEWIESGLVDHADCPRQMPCAHEQAACRNLTEWVAFHRSDVVFATSWSKPYDD